MFEHWNAFEADLWRFYGARIHEITFRRFLVALEGLPAESALVSRLTAARDRAEEFDRSWREELGAVTGRDYTRGARVPLEVFNAAIARGQSSRPEDLAER